MHRLACMLLIASLCQAYDDAPAILERARHAVAAQLARASNYACVQTLDRQYFVNKEREPRGCVYFSPTANQIPWMRDRLRLDVAVSEDQEIYSWHDAAKFTSSDVSDVVQTGPISSGNFIGFLRNVFISPGVQFTYVGQGDQSASGTYNFEYVVPVAHSAYHVQAKGRKPTIPFHGSFSIAKSDYELRRLQVIGDALPPDSPICSAETNITYQIVSISGQPSLIPAKFVLRLRDAEHVFTVSTSEYSQCREFRGESTLHFEIADASASSPIKEATAASWLPAGISLHIAIRTPVDDRTAYIGDSVRGVLLHEFKVPGTGMIVPKGATLEGLITELENHYLPVHFQIFSVKFNRLTSGNKSFLLNAWPKTSLTDRNTLRQVYGSPAPDVISAEESRGLFVFLSSHLHIDHNFPAHWVTGIPSPAEAGASPSQ